MASDRAKRINYVQGHVPGTQSVNTTPFCAGVTVICDMCIPVTDSRTAKCE